MTIFWLMTWALHAQATPPDALVQALSVRHGVGNCESLTPLSASLSDDLRHVVRHVELPPWAPMNAAICLIEEYPTVAQDDLTHWVRSENHRGLARLVFRRLGGIPTKVAVAIMEHAVTGPYREEAVAAVQLDPREEVRALSAQTRQTP